MIWQRSTPGLKTEHVVLIGDLIVYPQFVRRVLCSNREDIGRSAITSLEFEGHVTVEFIQDVESRHGSARRTRACCSEACEVLGSEKDDGIQFP